MLGKRRERARITISAFLGGYRFSRLSIRMPLTLRPHLRAMFSRAMPAH